MAYDDLRKGRFSETGRAYFVTTILADRRQACFNDFYCARLVVVQMRDLHEAGEIDSMAWVVMPDHVHWLFQLKGINTLAGVIKKFKARSAHKVNRYLERHGSLWQKAYYDHALRKEEEILDIARYIVANPLRAGLVKHIGDYAHWDAAWL